MNNRTLSIVFALGIFAWWVGVFLFFVFFNHFAIPVWITIAICIILIYFTWRSVVNFFDADFVRTHTGDWVSFAILPWSKDGDEITFVLRNRELGSTFVVVKLKDLPRRLRFGGRWVEYVSEKEKLNFWHDTQSLHDNWYAIGYKQPKHS